SFVAVEESIRTEGGKPVRIETPVEMPAGVSYEGIYGGDERKDIAMLNAPRAMGGFFGHGAVNQAAPMPTAPPPPSQARSYDEARQERDQRLASAALSSQLEKESGYRADSRKIDPALASVTSGKVQVKIALSDSSADALAKLKDAGFVLKQTSGRFVT